MAEGAGMPACSTCRLSKSSTSPCFQAKTEQCLRATLASVTLSSGVTRLASLRNPIGGW